MDTTKVTGLPPQCASDRTVAGVGGVSDPAPPMSSSHEGPTEALPAGASSQAATVEVMLLSEQHSLDVQILPPSGAASQPPAGELSSREVLELREKECGWCAEVEVASHTTGTQDDRGFMDARSVNSAFTLDPSEDESVVQACMDVDESEATDPPAKMTRSKAIIRAAKLSVKPAVKEDPSSPKAGPSRLPAKKKATAKAFLKAESRPARRAAAKPSRKRKKTARIESSTTDDSEPSAPLIPAATSKYAGKADQRKVRQIEQSMQDYEQQPPTAIYGDLLEWLKELEEERTKSANTLQGAVSGRMRDRIVRAKKAVLTLSGRDNGAYTKIHEQQLQIRI
ncbi:uncharacterized protein LOC109863281 [Pseudomyrmex gracilis]|uniref:uncharacterized protein LOC109863281 n=1 Tax=Pseudomyrmex gracilis TaxID=219809 RepID=UPI0009955AEF|nr:uncharacterized protein LOC109863281 [Pseudomyrmex gracilis]